MRWSAWYLGGIAGVAALVIALQPVRQAQAQYSGPDGLATPGPGPGGPA